MPSIWSEVVSLLNEFNSVEEVFDRPEILSKTAYACWCELIVLFVNSLSSGKPSLSPLLPTAPQRDLLLSMEQSARRVLDGDARVQWSPADIEEDFSKKMVSYTGEEVCKAEPLSLVRMLPGFPPEGRGGCPVQGGST